jgi:DNA repair ATPase RecN
MDGNGELLALKRWRGLMEELACSLERSRLALANSDLDSLKIHDGEQRELCHSLQELRPSVELARQSANSAFAGEGDIDGHRKRLLSELERVEQKVGYLNAVHAALLRRVCRSLAILSHLLAASAVTYGPPPGGARE